MEAAAREPDLGPAPVLPAAPLRGRGADVKQEEQLCRVLGGSHPRSLEGVYVLGAADPVCAEGGQLRS